MAYNSHRGVDYFIASSGQDPNKISTSSAGNDAVAQYQNLAIWLNDKSTSFQFFLPKTAHTEIQAGNLFIKLEKTWLAIALINLQFRAINSNLTRYPNDQILTATAIEQEESGFSLEVGEAESYGSWEQFKRSILLNSKLKINDETAEYISSKNIRLKLQHQGRELPKVWRNGQLHDWRNHFDVYRSDKPLIYQGWKSGKLNLSVFDTKNQQFNCK